MSTAASVDTGGADGAHCGQVDQSEIMRHLKTREKNKTEGKVKLSLQRHLFGFQSLLRC